MNESPHIHITIKTQSMSVSAISWVQVVSVTDKPGVPFGSRMGVDQLIGPIFWNCRGILMKLSEYLKLCAFCMLHKLPV
jgi:hypothetical protein